MKQTRNAKDKYCLNPLIGVIQNREIPRDRKLRKGATGTFAMDVDFLSGDDKVLEMDSSDDLTTM